jgi:hypothetical protein
MLGGQTVTIRTYTAGGRDRFNAPTRTPVDTPVNGCSMQPLSVAESVGLTDVETEMWKCYLPPVPAALTVDTKSEIIYNTMTFQVLGAKPGVDLAGRTDHICLELKKQIA